MKTLRLILGDQLNPNHTWFSTRSDDVIYVLMEIRSETDYVVHHIQKILGFFGAMRKFSENLTTDGHRVLHLQIDDLRNQQSFTENLTWISETYRCQRIEYLLPDEYRVDQELSQLESALKLPVKSYDSEHFLTSRDEVKNLFSGKKTFLMERFYRYMRKRFNILMDGDKPLTRQWNHDQENRKRLGPDVKFPAPLLFEHDLTEIYRVIKKSEIKTIGGVVPEKFIWPLDRTEALMVLNHFLKYSLVNFGTYQDAMTPDDDWLFHSRISFALNTKMISPLEVIQAAVREWQSRQDEITYPQIEGFVRQILGWREYVRGIYWAKMPTYQESNFLGHTRKLPGFFWTGETKMDCMSHAINQSLEHAYAHHIQRLMITGNFALLAGINPNEVDRWYLGIYIDAIQWVEITNTRGMSQFADGGLLATKPYVSSANYIDKMSSYCGGCFYDKKARVGERACPFNSLYWDFFARNEDRLRGNHRLAITYKNLDRMQDLSQVRARAAQCIEQIEKL